MANLMKTRLPEILKKYEKEILEDWLREQTAAISRQKQLLKEGELREQCTEFLKLFADAAQKGDFTDMTRSEWSPVLDLLTQVSRSRGLQGFLPSETATFV